MVLASFGSYPQENITLDLNPCLNGWASLTEWERFDVNEHDSNKNKGGNTIICVWANDTTHVDALVPR